MIIMKNLYSGRIDPKNWIRNVVLSSFITVVVWLFLASLLESDHISTTAYWLAVLLLLAVAGVMTSASSVRRFHDKGESGRYALYLLIPLINLVVLKDLLAPGQATTNKYGAPIPKQAHQSSSSRVASVFVALIVGGVIFSILTVAMALISGSVVTPAPPILLGLVVFATLMFWKWLRRP